MISLCLCVRNAMMKPINVSPIFWSFVRMIVDSSSQALYSSAQYNWFQRMSETHRPIKLHIDCLKDVTHFDYDVPDGVYVDNVWVVFPDIPTLFQGLLQIYAYQQPSESKTLIEKCYTKICHLTDEHSNVFDTVMLHDILTSMQLLQITK